MIVPLGGNIEALSGVEPQSAYSEGG
jgi:hypothetical protein